MSEIQELSDGDKAFLQSHLPAKLHRQQNGEQSQSRPWVTLTYACSLDGMISHAPGVRTSLSGMESKSMTHYLRLHHDAILVGVSTAVADDPSLNSRYPGMTLDSQPQPVIIDPNSRWSLANSKVRKLADDKRGKGPWVISHASTSSSFTDFRSDRCDTPPGCKRILLDTPRQQQSDPVVSEGHPKFTWISILERLKAEGIESVMIEGGATIINDLLRDPALVDSVIVTIAPTWLGHGGVAVSPVPYVENGERSNVARLEKSNWRQFGEDVVLCGTLRR